MKPSSPGAPPAVAGLHARLDLLFRQLETGLHERGQAIRHCLLAAIAGESVFFLGLPGVAKSLVARRLETAFEGARCFDYLMGRFSTPEEIFGPVSIKRLKDEDLYVRRVDDYLPAADIVFLDEIWKAGPPIQNALLTALNEKLYRNGAEELRLPLKLLIAASNETAPDESALAFWDRFLIRIELKPLQDPAAFRAMILDREDPFRDTVAASSRIQTAEWESWRRQCQELELGEDAVAIILELRALFSARHASGSGPYVSDRRWKKLAGLLRASAFCHGRLQATALDCFVLEHCLWHELAERPLVAEALRQVIQAKSFRAEIHETAFEARREALAQEFRAATRVERETRQAEPVIADGEYYRLARQGSGPEYRIWKQDWDSLPAEDAPGQACELFRYGPGGFEGTETKRCNRGKDWVLLVDGKAFPLVCEERLSRRTETKELDRAALQAWEKRVEAFQAECRAEATRVAALIGDLTVEIGQHFYLPPDAEESLLLGLRRYVQDLAAIEARAAACLEPDGC